MSRGFYPHRFHLSPRTRPIIIQRPLLVNVAQCHVSTAQNIVACEIPLDCLVISLSYVYFVHPRSFQQLTSPVLYFPTGCLRKVPGTIHAVVLPKYTMATRRVYPEIKHMLKHEKSITFRRDTRQKAQRYASQRHNRATINFMVVRKFSSVLISNPGYEGVARIRCLFSERGKRQVVQVSRKEVPGPLESP